MALNIDTVGHCSPGNLDLVMIHGWGMHCDVFADVIPLLAPHYRILLIDLPGHGRNAAQPTLPDFPDLVDSLVSALTTVEGLQSGPGRRLAWLGWSLGGQVAMTMAQRHPAWVEQLILVASSPRFVAADGWPHGMDPSVFAGFADSLKANHRETWERFLALEVHGSAAQKRDLRHLKNLALAWPTPTASILGQGLKWLHSNNLLGDVSQMHLPVMVLGGSRDRLVPPAAIDWLAQQLPRGQAHIFRGAGHAPFLSDPEAFSQAVLAFLNAHRSKAPETAHV